MTEAGTADGAVPVRQAIRELAAQLGNGPGDSPQSEAELVCAHVLGCERVRLAAAGDLDTAQWGRATELARSRVDTGAPLQYVLGSAVSGRLDLAVGPGVFIPRPETEILVALALEALAALPARRPIIVDLCAGSGTLALEIAHARPDAEVHAVELHPQALGWLRRNVAARAAAGDTEIHVHPGDATDPQLLASLRGLAAIVVSNPPYIPEGADLPAEVREHEPAAALFGGPDGLGVIRPLVGVAAGLLAPGGLLGIEHDDATGDSTAAIIAGHGGFGTVEQHADLAGRPRHVTAVRAAPAPAHSEKGSTR